MNLRTLFRPSEDKKFAKRIKKITGYRPGNLKIYFLAFTHKTSAVKIHNGDLKEDNERLEFLGDAVLDLVVAEILFNRFPYKSEGFLTEMRSKMVSRDRLGKIAVKIGLQDIIRYDRSMLGRQAAMQSLGGNALEALVGAFYLDKGYRKTVTFIKKKIIEEHLDFKELEESEISYKGRLFQYAQKTKMEIKFEVVKEFRRNRETFFEVSVSLNKEVLASEIFNSKKRAEELASEKAYKKMLEEGKVNTETEE